MWILAVVLYYSGVLTFEVLGQFSIGGSLGLFLIKTPQETIILIAIGILCLSVTANYYGYFKKKEIEARKKIEFLFWIMMASLIAILIFKGIQPHFVIFLMLPVSILLAITLHSVKQIGRVELLHVTVLFLVLFLQYNQLIMVDI
jgi:membrane-associated HD superfamily phosphohydrolase